MLRSYPVERPSSAPATGRLLYEHLMKNLGLPAAANHTIWFEGEKAKLEQPAVYAFRGGIPTGQSLELVTLSGKDISSKAPAHPPGSGIFLYDFDGTEGPVFVSDLAGAEKSRLGLPAQAQGREKVYNPNFRPYEELNQFTRYSNELAAMAVPKSISSYFGGKGNINYSEVDVLHFLTACVTDLNSPEMRHVLHANNMAWSALAYMREDGTVAGDLLMEFHGQNPADFYMKDVGTVLPMIFYALALLGQDPITAHDLLDTQIFGAKEAAAYMRQFRKPLVQK